MKYVNFYSGTALVIIASILGSLGSTTGELAPPLILGALLFTVLVLGWAGGASDARHELDRLARLESGRQLLAQSHIRQRDQLEEANEALRDQVRDCQAAIVRFTAAQARNMIRITALEGENAELRKRPAIDVTPSAARGVVHGNDTGDDAALYAFAIVYGRAMDSNNIELAAFDGVNYMFPDGDCFEREGDTLDGFTAEFLTLYQLEVRLIESVENGKKWHEAHGIAVDRIVALEAESVKLRKRPSAEVVMATAQRLIAELNDEPDDVDEECRSSQARGIGYLHTELLNQMDVPPPVIAHADDLAVDCFAAAVKAKLSAGRATGRGGWDDPAKCPIERLQDMLVECVEKGDPVDVGALAMMIQQRGGRTALAQHQQNVLLALLSPQPLVEPVYIGKALMAHREARVVLAGGTGPVAAVHLVNIGLTGWVYTKDAAEAFARGWNGGVQALRGALTEAVVGKLLPAAIVDSLPGSANTASTCGCHACLHIAGITAAVGMVLCPTCGCKRCPHANDHRHACTGSNEPGQPGSAYPANVKPLAPGEQ